MPPATIILMHQRENLKTCTVWPLHERSDIDIRFWPACQVPTEQGLVRIGLGGPPLSMADADAGFVLVDATWRLAPRIEAACSHLPLRSLPPCRSAYPRISQHGHDPDAGLATVEALFLAYRICGRPTDGLLDHYRWAEDFRALNTL